MGSAGRDDLGGVGGQAQDGAPGIAPPPGRHETAERRHKVHPCTDPRYVSLLGVHDAAGAQREHCSSALHMQHELTQARSVPKPPHRTPDNCSAATVWLCKQCFPQAISSVTLLRPHVAHHASGPLSGAIIFPKARLDRRLRCRARWQPALLIGRRFPGRSDCPAASSRPHPLLRCCLHRSSNFGRKFSPANAESILLLSDVHKQACESKF